jgi:hypothetical protein
MVKVLRYFLRKYLKRHCKLQLLGSKACKTLLVNNALITSNRFTNPIPTFFSHNFDSMPFYNNNYEMTLSTNN